MEVGALMGSAMASHEVPVTVRRGYQDWSEAGFHPGGLQLHSWLRGFLCCSAAWISDLREAAYGLKLLSSLCRVSEDQRRRVLRLRLRRRNRGDIR